MSKFTPKVEILGLLAFFVSDFFGSSRLPGIIFFAPNFGVHIIYLANDEPTGQKKDFFSTATRSFLCLYDDFGTRIHVFLLY